MKVGRAALLSAGTVVAVCLVAGCQPAAAPEPGIGSAVASYDPGVVESGSTAEAVDPLAPVIIDPAVPTAVASVGAYLTFVVPDADVLTTTISSSDPTVVEVIDATNSGGMMMTAAGTALAPGSAIITFTSPDGTSADVTLTVTE